MSDRTQSSVRTGSRSGDAEAAVAPAGATPVTSTQSIPGAATPRTQGSTPGAAGAATPTGTTGSPGAAAVPPVQQAGNSPSGATAMDTPADDKDKARSRGRGPAKPGGRGPRRARLQLRHVDI
jgi:hypothetical protein